MSKWDTLLQNLQFKEISPTLSFSFSRRFFFYFFISLSTYCNICVLLGYVSRRWTIWSSSTPTSRSTPPRPSTNANTVFKVIFSSLLLLYFKLYLLSFACFFLLYPDKTFTNLFPIEDFQRAVNDNSFTFFAGKRNEKDGYEEK